MYIYDFVFNCYKNLCKLFSLIPKHMYIYLHIAIFKFIAKYIIQETNHSEYNTRNFPQPVRWITSHDPLRSFARWKMREPSSQKFLYFAFYIYFFPFFFYIPRCPFANIPRRLARANISQITRSAIKNAKRCTGLHGN